MPDSFEQSIEEISLTEYIQVIKKRKWVIFWTLVTALLIVFFANYLLSPVYKAVTTVLVAEKSSSANIIGISDLDVLVGGRDKMETQVEIIKSRWVAEAVLEKLPADIFKQAEAENFQRRKDELRWVINILDFFRLKKLVANILGVSSNGKPPFPDTLTEKEKLEIIMNSISVSLLKNTNIIEISSQMSNPKLASEIANQTAEVYVEQSRSINRTQASEAKRFIEEQLKAKEKELMTIEEEILAFKEKENILYLDEETKLNIEQLAKFQAQKLEIETQIVENKARLNEIVKQLSEQSETVISSQVITANPIVQQLQNKLADLQIALPTLKEKYSEKSPQVTEVEIQIQQIENEISKKVAEIVGSKVSSINPIYQNLLSQMITMETNIISLETKIKSILEIISQYEDRLKELPEKEIQLARLERAVRVAENIYLTLLERYQEARISEAMELGDIRVIDRAQLPDKPIKPRKMLNMAIGGVLGLMMGVLLVFFLEFFDHSFKNREDVENYLQLPILGIIPYVEINHQKSGKKKKYKS